MHKIKYNNFLEIADISGAFDMFLYTIQTAVLLFYKTLHALDPKQKNW